MLFLSCTSFVGIYFQEKIKLLVWKVKKQVLYFVFTVVFSKLKVMNLIFCEIFKLSQSCFSISRLQKSFLNKKNRYNLPDCSGFFYKNPIYTFFHNTHQPFYLHQKILQLASCSFLPSPTIFWVFCSTKARFRCSTYRTYYPNLFDLA